MGRCRCVDEVGYQSLPARTPVDLLLVPPEFQCLAVHLGFSLCKSSASFEPYQNLWKVSVFPCCFPCRLQEAVVMETVRLTDVCCVFTGSDTAELKAGSNVTQYVGSDPLKNPRCWCSWWC